MGLLDDKVVLVNGGSHGVGAAVTRAAVRAGAVVAVTGRRPEPGEALVAELAAARGKAVFVRSDLVDAEQAGRTRSPTSSCSCCPSGPVWSPVR